MADDTRDTRPGAAPGALTTGADGSLPDLGGRRAWVWMQDTDEGGGGRFDVRADRVDVWRRKGATVVPNYPLHFGPAGRTGKPATGRRDTTAAPTISDGGTGGPLSQTGEPHPGEERVDQAAGEQPADGEPVDDRRLNQPDGEPVEDRRLDQPTGEPVNDERIDQPPAGEDTDQAAGEPAAAETKTRRGGRTR